jgi:hypothetical protein
MRTSSSTETANASEGPAMSATTIHGKCHCGNIRYALQWPAASRVIARACGCSFCRKHGGNWTSHPDARLEVTIAAEALVSRYRFGTGTAEFCVCAGCGVAPLVTSTIEGRTYAVVNVNAFETLDPAALERRPAQFDGEAVDARLERRTRSWIADVTIRAVSAAAAAADASAGDMK